MKEQKEEEEKRKEEKLEEGLWRPRRINTACSHTSRKQKDVSAFHRLNMSRQLEWHSLAAQHTSGKPDLLGAAILEALGESTVVCNPQDAGQGRGGVFHHGLPSV